MSAPDRAQALVLGWARVYTRGLDDLSRQRRLDELASDCHEQRHWGVEVGASPVAVATSMVVRTLAGVPADLRWRRTQAATTRDRSRFTEGRPMGRWIREKWWIVLAGLVGVFLIVLGVALPFEDRTVGAWIGGAVHAALGVTMLAGLRVRRTRRQRGDIMIAVGTLALMPWLWTVVLPVVGLLVLVPALIDLADASVTGAAEQADAREAGRPEGRDPLTIVFVGTLIAAVAAAVAIGSETPAVVLVSPALALLASHLLLRRLPVSRTIRLGATFIASNFVHGVLLMVAVFVTDEGLDLDGTWGDVVNYLLASIGVVGLGLVVAGWMAGRRQARPA